MYYFVRLVKDGEPAFFKSEDEQDLYAEVIDLDLNDFALENCILVSVSLIVSGDMVREVVDFKSADAWLAEMQE